MDILSRFESRLDYFCKLSNIPKNDGSLWYDILSKNLLSIYIPQEFIWNNRLKPWDWSFLEQNYELANFMKKYRNENWSYKYMLNEYHNRKYCNCIEWLHN